jgi:hypothetical protein
MKDIGGLLMKSEELAPPPTSRVGVVSPME